MICPTGNYAYRQHLGKQRYPKKQQGAALVLALVILAILTVFAINSYESATREETILGNTNEYRIAFNAADASLTDALTDVVDGSAKSCNVCGAADASSCAANQPLDFSNCPDNAKFVTTSNSAWEDYTTNIQLISNTQIEALVDTDYSSAYIPKRTVVQRSIRFNFANDGRSRAPEYKVYGVTAKAKGPRQLSEVEMQQYIIQNVSSQSMGQ